MLTDVRIQPSDLLRNTNVNPTVVPRFSGDLGLGHDADSLAVTLE